MQSSIHVARWMRLLEGAGFDVLIFPVLNAAVHPQLRDVTVVMPELVGESTVPTVPAEGRGAPPSGGGLRAIGRALAHLASRPGRHDASADGGRAQPRASRRVRTPGQLARYLGRGPPGGAAAYGGWCPYLLRHPFKALRGAAAVLRYGDAQMRTPREARRSPLVLRYPRRALIEAANIVRFGQPTRPWEHEHPANLAAKRPRRPGPAHGPRELRDQPTDDRVRFVALPLSLAQFGCDPRAAAQEERASAGDSTDPWFGPRVLAEAVARFQPDLVHSMEFQRCAYLVLEAKQRMADTFPTWMASNWGSDIHHFAQDLDHRRRIMRVLAAIDLYAAECERDIALARDLGYDGPVFPVVPSSGGFDLAACARLRVPGPTSARRTVIVKGYQHFVGRALMALQAIADNADSLRDYVVLVYSATPDVIEAAAEIARTRAVRIECLPQLPHEEMLARFGAARIYVGLSASDAISTGVLESMVMGAFPIQTDTSCCNEWFADGEGGFIVELAAPEVTAARLRQAIEDDALVDRAAAINWKTAQRRLDIRGIKPIVVAAYERALQDVRRVRSTEPSAGS